MELWAILGVLFITGSYVILSRRVKTGEGAVFTSCYAIDSLSIEQACAIVDDIVSKGEVLIAEPASGDIQFLDQLGPVTKGFFSKYRVLRTKQGNLRLSLDEVRILKCIQGCISIGHVEDWDIIQDSRDDSVFSMEGGEIYFEIEIERYPSVYHFILDEIA